MSKITATIIRKTDFLDRSRLCIGWDSDSSGDYPATLEGLAELKADIKSDSMASADDFDAIDAMTLPEEDGHGDRVSLTGEGDPG